MKSPYAALVALAVTSCGPAWTGHTGTLDTLPELAPTGASLSTDRTSYIAGDAATITLRNTSRAGLGYNLCFAQLRDSDGRILADLPNDMACQAIMHGLAPGAAAERSPRALPADLRTGRYRYVTSVEAADGRRYRLASPDFDVLALSEP